MKAAVYTAKKVAIAQIDGVEIRDTEGGQMIRFIVPGRGSDRPRPRMMWLVGLNEYTCVELTESQED